MWRLEKKLLEARLRVGRDAACSMLREIESIFHIPEGQVQRILNNEG